MELIKNRFSRHLFIYLVCGYFATILLSAIIKDDIVTGVLLFAYIIAFFFVSLSQKMEYQEPAYYFSFLVFLSVFQNVFLGVFSLELSKTQISLFLSVGLILSIVLLLRLTFGFKDNKATIFFKRLILFFVIVAICSSIIFPSELSAFISSLRNISSPLILISLGLFASKYIDKKVFVKFYTAFFIIAFLFGLYEIIFDPNVWIKLNIQDLWAKKGIPLWGKDLPVNFLSSEFIFGEQQRRMSSTFADPVNFGTFIAFGFIIYGYQKKKFLMFLTFIAALLVVSKGAILTMLIYLIVRTWSKKNKVFFILMIIFAAVFAVGFIIFTEDNSTNSVQAHLDGFFSSLTVIFTKPFGYGLGNVGTLANLFTDTAANEIKESGFGMVVGQLGIVGLIIYALFIAKVINVCLRYCKCTNYNDIIPTKIVLTLLISILINAVFNEVALSPNSNNTYFIYIGILVDEIYEKYYRKAQAYYENTCVKLASVSSNS